MQTIAQQLNVKEFPFKIEDKNGRVIYFEDSNGSWCRWQYDFNGNVIYYEDSDGNFKDNRLKGCEGKIVEIDGKKCKLIEVNTKER